MKYRPALTSADVETIMNAAKAEAEKNKWKVSIAVVDDGGCLLHLIRLDGAGPMTVDVAVAKGRTAGITRRPTKAWEEMVKNRPTFIKFPDNMPVEGGLPIMHEGECVGAVGVSGVQSHEDEQVALAGVKALQA